MPAYHSASGSVAEDLFIELFSETFGAEKAGYLYSQYHFYDIYQNSRYADFVLENGARRVAIEIDDETSHNKSLVASNKFYDDLLKQNSMVHLGWDVYRWAVRQMQIQPEAVKDELRVFLGSHPQFKEIEDYLPQQRGKALDGVSLELKEHQKAALNALRTMRANRETIALLYHATGTGKTVTAVMDARSCGGRVLFLAHTQELVNQAAETFRKLWSSVTIGRYMETIKQPNAHVVCGSIQSVAMHLDQFKDNDFDYLIVDEAHHASADTYQKVLAYFKPSFTLGLTATPERTDDNKVILDIFKNTAHKLDIQTAVEIGELVPIRCIRIHTNIDLTKVRFNSIQYNIRDLESKIYMEDCLQDEFPSKYQESIGLPRYQQELDRLKRADIVHKNFSNRLEQSAKERDTAQRKLFNARREYTDRFKPCSFRVEAVDNDEFEAEQKLLEESELPKYREKIKAARESAMEQFQNDFLAKLKSSIDQVQDQVKNLNRALRQAQFGTDSYQFRVERNPDYAEYYDMIMDPELMEGDVGLFARPFQDKYGQLIEKLFSQITTADDTQLNARKQSELQENIQRYTDFRTYLKFDLETTDQNGTKQMLSQTLNTKSGGETQTPFYIAVLASFAQLYRVNDTSSFGNTVRLAVFDEAFNKMDSDRIIESVRLLRRMGLQAIICTPPDKVSDIMPIADRTLLVNKDKYRMHILPFGKEIAQ